jgi:hypothetical protein
MEGAPQFTGTVRWESAKPIVEALKTRLPDAFADRYVISVSGFPMMSGHRRSLQAEGDPSPSPQDTLDDLKAFTFLKPKDKEPAQPGIVQPQQRSDSAVLLFGFLEELLDLDLDDKEVAFSTRLGRLTLRTKFNLKEMMYHGKLAV